MVMVTDMEKSIQFYRDKMEFSMKFSSDFWTEFEVGETTIALHGGATEKAGAEKGDAGNCTFGFYVDNIDGVYKTLCDRGVEFIQSPKRKENEGIILSTCVDPNGLKISITQKM